MRIASFAVSGRIPPRSRITGSAAAERPRIGAFPRRSLDRSLSGPAHPGYWSSTLSKVKLYDTTLRDGMQGQGMSLSASEKVRVVHALDELGVQVIEAGFPGSNP